MNNFIRVLLWLFIRPYQFLCWLYNILFELASLIEAGATRLFNKVASIDTWQASNRAWLILYEVDKERPPFTWERDAWLIRRACIGVGGALAALIALPLLGIWLAPHALDVAHNASQWARACLLGGTR